MKTIYYATYSSYRFRKDLAVSDVDTLVLLDSDLYVKCNAEPREARVYRK
ncbi:MAG: hypothetical protein LBU65_05305 [Planctomycetaceae bacterium]|nr:hypothetical protein [Planctomycetaceae bacterium]